jgi:hypothetical protein
MLADHPPPRTPVVTAQPLMLRRMLGWLMLAVITLGSGCGSTKSYLATDQLLMSDAVDATVAKLDFSPMSGKKVFLDPTYIRTAKGPLLIDSDYVVSSVRQQMVGAGVQIVENREEAELIAEARLGALGLDGHNVIYGIPASNGLAAASTAITSVPMIPAIPEISFARHEAKSGAAKLAVFAYDRVTREPYWQSGIAKSASSAHDTWVLGIGPWQKGTIYDRTRFAGSVVSGGEPLDAEDKKLRSSAEFQSYRRGRLYNNVTPQPETRVADSSGVVTAGTEAAPKTP